MRWGGPMSEIPGARGVANRGGRERPGRSESLNRREAMQGHLKRPLILSKTMTFCKRLLELLSLETGC